MSTAGVCRAWRATAAAPGAIAIIELEGDVEPVLRALGVPAEIGGLHLRDFAGIDHGLIVRTGPAAASLMPHGGPAVVSALLEHLRRLAVSIIDPDEAAIDARYPEGRDDVERLMLAALARAPSPAAVDRLLDEPRRWREDTSPLTAEDRARAARLDRLLTPARVVVAGLPNAGKSTLANVLAGRNVAIATAWPGTTRDPVGVRLDLAGLVVDWIDTPGLRPPADAAEAVAIEYGRTFMDDADLLVAVAEPDAPWPELPRPPDLRVGTKGDQGPRPDADLAVSALGGTGLEALTNAIRNRLVPPEDLRHPGRWIFDPALLVAARDEKAAPSGGNPLASSDIDH